MKTKTIISKKVMTRLIEVCSHIAEIDMDVEKEMAETNLEMAFRIGPMKIKSYESLDNNNEECIVSVSVLDDDYICAILDVFDKHTESIRMIGKGIHSIISGMRILTTGLQKDIKEVNSHYEKDWKKAA